MERLYGTDDRLIQDNPPVTKYSKQLANAHKLKIAAAAEPSGQVARQKNRTIAQLLRFFLDLAPHLLALQP